MSREAMVIVNPNSANGKTARWWTGACSQLRGLGLDFDWQYTTASWTAPDIARRALYGGYSLIVAVGGDGTVNEVINGFFDRGKTINPGACLGVVARGTGCDLARTLGLPRNSDESLERLVQGGRRALDVGRVNYINYRGSPEERYFINIADAGLGGETVARVNKNSKEMKGFLSFLWGVVVSIAHHRGSPMEVWVDGCSVHQGPLSLAAVANGKYFGGGMLIAPGAAPDDGLFEVLLLEAMGRPELIFNLPKVYLGRHIGHPKVKIYKGTHVSIISDSKVLVDIDGEQPGCLGATFSLLPGALQVKG